MIDEATAACFWAQVDTSGECWLWAGALADSGHGSFRYSGRTVGAHRVAYELTYGPVPSGKLVCHSCNNAQCVRPTHLYAGTSAQNRQDRARAGIYRYDVPRVAGTDLLSPTQAMRRLGIDAVALYWLVQNGELPIYRSHANCWCYKQDEVAALAEKRLAK